VARIQCPFGFVGDSVDFLDNIVIELEIDLRKIFWNFGVINSKQPK